MNFITNKIVTKTVSLEEACKKAATPSKIRSLDELLAERKAQIKTASAEPAQTKTAQVEPAPAAAPVAAAPEAKPEAKVEPKVEAKVEEATVKVAEANDIEVVEVKDEPAKVEPVVAKPANVTLKVAKKLDFRSWNAEDVVKAWSQHGDIKGCIENVAGSVSDPKTYCGLLQVASSEAMKVVKASAAKQQKTASSTFVKVSKLTDKDRAMLAKYYTRIYGKDYVNAMLEDY